MSEKREWKGTTLRIPLGDAKLVYDVSHIDGEVLRRTHRAHQLNPWAAKLAYYEETGEMPNPKFVRVDPA